MADTDPRPVDLQIRPVRADDAEALRRMFDRLSPETIHRRFFTLLPSLDDRMLARLLAADHQRHEAVVAVVDGEVIGLASYHRSPAEPATAEVAIVVQDSWQHRGVGRRMVQVLGSLAAHRGIEQFHAEVLPDNRSAAGLIRRVNPGSKGRLVGGTLAYDLSIPPAA